MSPAPDSSTVRCVKRVAILATAAAFAYVVWSIWDHEALTRWIQSARPMPFFTAMAILPALGFPITPFYILAGAAYTPAVALVGSTLALAANLALCYAVARFMRRMIERLLRRFEYPLPDLAARRGAAFRLAVAVRFAPGVPFVAKNYAIGVARVPFPVYFALSMLISGASAAFLILLGKSLFEHELAIPAIAVLAVLAICLWWWRRKHEAEAPSAHAV
jgi:uncharacterized membrane protein YdjX (TVP38/TMEM64 family)